MKETEKKEKERRRVPSPNSNEYSSIQESDRFICRVDEDWSARERSYSNIGDIVSWLFCLLGFRFLLLLCFLLFSKETAAFQDAEAGIAGNTLGVCMITCIPSLGKVRLSEGWTRECV